MVHSFTTALTTTVFVLACFLSQAQAQSNPQEKRDIRNGWIAVVLGDDGKPKEDIGAALTLKEAQDLERDWTARRPGTVILTDSIEGEVEVSSGKIRRATGYDSKPKDSGNPISPSSKIVGSNLGMVDPGARADSTRPAGDDDRKRLVGKKFKGAIGDVAIDIEFFPNGKVKISSLVQGKALEAKWYFDEKGQLRIDANADFVAIRRGDKFEGTRTTKDKRDSRPWSFNLQSVVNADDSLGKAYKDPRVPLSPPKSLKGTWAKGYIEFDESDKVTFFGSTGQLNSRSGSLKANVSGKKISIKLTATGYYEGQSVSFDGEWDGNDEIHGTISPIYPDRYGRGPHKVVFSRDITK